MFYPQYLLQYLLQSGKISYNAYQLMLRTPDDGRCSLLSQFKRRYLFWWRRVLAFSQRCAALPGFEFFNQYINKFAAARYEKLRGKTNRAVFVPIRGKRGFRGFDAPGNRLLLRRGKSAPQEISI